MSSGCPHLPLTWRRMKQTEGNDSTEGKDAMNQELSPRTPKGLVSRLRAHGRTLFVVLGASAVAATFMSCSTVTRTVNSPPHIAGATFVGNESCSQCHAETVRDFKTASHSHLKAEGPNALEIGCESCHGPGSKHNESGGAARTITNPRRSSEACFQCHLEMRARFNLPSHHPVTEGKVSCADCHNPHKGDIIAGGTKSLHGDNELCFKCHMSQRGPFVYEHEATREGCVICHNPHGTVNARMLRERNSNLCLKCHFQQQLAGGVITIGGRNHNSSMTRGSCFTAGCHEAIHGSQVNSSLRF